MGAFALTPNVIGAFTLPTNVTKTFTPTPSVMGVFTLTTNVKVYRILGAG